MGRDGDDSILEDVERYNEEDAARRTSCTSGCADRPATCRGGCRPTSARRQKRPRSRCRPRGPEGRLLDGAEEGEPRRLLANLLGYHQREGRPEWWAWFRWPQLDDNELVRDRTAIGGLEWDGKPPEVEGQSHAYRMAFPPQEHKISGTAHDPRTRARFRVRVDDDNGIVTVLRASIAWKSRFRRA